MSNKGRNPDGTERLCKALYGEVKPRNWVGGSNANMLHDAADQIEKLNQDMKDIIEAWRKNICFADEVRREDGSYAHVVGRDPVTDIHKLVTLGEKTIADTTFKKVPNGKAEAARSTLFPYWWPDKFFAKVEKKV